MTIAYNAGENRYNTQTECLYSTIRNLCSTEKYLGFVPPHGRRLDAGESLSFWGNIQDWLNRNTPNDRARHSLEAALVAGKVAIVKTPAVFVVDSTWHETQMLAARAGVFITTDPCWGAYSSKFVSWDDHPKHIDIER